MASVVDLLRQDLDDADAALIVAIEYRFALVVDIMRAKIAAGRDPTDVEREQLVLDRAGAMLGDDGREVFRLLVEIGKRRAERQLTI